MSATKTFTIYVLQIDDNKWYVGKTTDLKRRLGEHMLGEGSQWTKNHKFIKLVEYYESDNDYEEDNKTLELINKYGIDNVRGGSYSQETLNEEETKVLQQLIKSNNDNIEKIIIIKDCDWTNKYYFERTGGRKINYSITFPGIFKRKENRHYSIVMYVPVRDITYRNIYFTIEEYMDMINVLWNIPNGSYIEKEYFNKCNETQKNYDSISKVLNKTMSKKLVEVFTNKGLISREVKSSKSWFDWGFSEKSEENLLNMANNIMNDDDDWIALRIIFAQKSILSFITF